MTRRDMMKNAVSHKNGPVPSFIRFCEDKYYEDLYRRYADDKVRKLYDSKKISFGEAVGLAIGNCTMMVFPPWWDWYEVPECYHDWDTPDFLPKTRGTGSYDSFFNYVKMLNEETDAYILVTIYGSHFEKAYFTRGIENYLADMAASPEFAQALLDKIISKNMIMLDNILDTEGFDGVLLGSDWGSQKSLLMSPDVWHKMIEKGEQKEYDRIHSSGRDVWVHSCGNIEQIMPDLARMGVDVLNPIQPECMDIQMLKHKYGNSIAYWGGISTQKTLPYGTPEEVKKETRRIIEMMSANGGFIAAPSQDVQCDVPYENICALIDTIKEYR